MLGPGLFFFHQKKHPTLTTNSLGNFTDKKPTVLVYAVALVPFMLEHLKNPFS